MTLRIFALLALVVFALNTFDERDEKQKLKSVAEQRAALGELQSYVGQWRGVGQLRRGSRAGAWTEQAEVAWKLRADSAAIVASSPKAKYFKAMQFSPLADSSRFQMIGKADIEGELREIRYSGGLDEDGVLELAVETPTKNMPDRVKVRLAAEGKRLVVLYEQKDGSRFARMAEVGFTRRGSGFGAGSTGIECIVTGGTGTIAVRFEGKTYYVCCSGCKEYFDDDPVKTMREYRERKKTEKAEKANR